MTAAKKEATVAAEETGVVVGRQAATVALVPLDNIGNGRSR